MNTKTLFRLELLLAGVMFLWCGWLLYQFWLTHPTYGWGLADPLSAWGKNLRQVLPLFLVLWGGSVGWLCLWKKRLSVSMIVSGLWLLMVVGMLVWGLQRELFANFGLLASGVRMAGTVGVMLLGVLVFTLTLGVVGRKIREIGEKRYEIRITNYELRGRDFLVRRRDGAVSPTDFQDMAVGFAVIATVGFGLAKLGFFQPLIWAGLLIGALLVWWRDGWQIVRDLWSRRITLTKLEIGLGSLIGTVVILNVLQSFFPFSVGWDSANEYLLTVKNLAEDGVLRSGIFPPFTEIVLAVGGQFLGLSFVQFLLVLWGSSLVVTLLWLGQKMGLSRSWNIAVATLFFLIPAVQFQLSRDLKLDLIFLQFVLIALGLWWDGKKKWSTFLVGFAPLLKLTALWLWPGVLLLALKDAMHRVSTGRGKHFLVSLVLLILPLTIWGGVNLLQTDSWSQPPQELLHTALRGEIPAPQLPLVNVSTGTSFTEEVQRYGTFTTDPLARLWAAMTNLGVPENHRQYVDLGWWWLALLPVTFVLLLWRDVRRTIASSHWELVTVAGIFFLLWLTVGEVVAWYVFPALAVLLLWGTKGIVTSRYIHHVFVMVVCVSIGLGLLSRLQHSYGNPITTSVSWATFPNADNAQRLAQVFFADEMRAAEFINADNRNVYRIGTMIPFWIDDSDARTLSDAQLDIFTSLLAGDTPLSLLQKHNFGWVVFDTNTAAIEQDPNGTLHQKVDRFTTFARENFEEVWRGERLILFRVPPENF